MKTNNQTVGNSVSYIPCFTDAESGPKNKAETERRKLSYLHVSYADYQLNQLLTSGVGNVGNARFLRSALLLDEGVGNVGNPFRVSYVPAPGCADVSAGVCGHA